MPVTTTSLLTLPVDVLLVIRDVISSAPFTSTDPGLGLLAHLSLSQTCRRLRDIYTFSTRESDDLFWKRACAMAGYGRPMRREYPHALPGSTTHDTPTPDVFTWKQIALIVTAHTRVCEIRSCRNASCWPGTLRFPAHPSHATPPHNPSYTSFWNKSFICSHVRRRRGSAAHDARLPPAFLLPPLLSWRGARSRERAAHAAPDASGLPAQGLCAALWTRERFVCIRDIATRALYHSFASRLGECDCERTQS